MVAVTFNIAIIMEILLCTKNTNSSICFLYKHVLLIPWDQDTVPRMKLDTKLPDVLTLEEIEKLIDSAREIRNKAIIALLYSSGLRVGELVKLRPEDIYMSTMQVYVPKSKNHRDRWTILSNRALERPALCHAAL